MRLIDALKDREQARRLLDPLRSRAVHGHPAGDGAGDAGAGPPPADRQHREQRTADRDSAGRARPEGVGRADDEHVASPYGDYFFPYFGDAGFIGDDVVAYFIREDETPIMLQRCHRPSSRAELEQIRAARGAQGGAAGRGESPPHGTPQGASVTRYLYSARILPIGKPVVIPDVKGGGWERMTFTENSFRLERKSRNPAKVLLDPTCSSRSGRFKPCGGTRGGCR